jgi:hypothetical protein
MVRRVYVSGFLTLVLACALVLAAAPAGAQYRPLTASGKSSDSANAPKGEPYHVEVAFNLWNPLPVFTVSSEGLGIPGSTIDVQADLAMAQKQTYEVRASLRPAKKHKFNFHYVPLVYQGTTTLRTAIIFNGIRFPVSAAVDSELRWNTFRFGYEYDFVSKNWGYIGMLLEGKYTDAQFTLTSPVDTEYVRAQAPIPALGFTGRAYITKYASITGEFSFFKLPENIQSLQQYQAHYFDYDIYGTVNFTHNFGVQAGYRTLDLRYAAKADKGEARLDGFYFGGVARF